LLRIYIYIYICFLHIKKKIVTLLGHGLADWFREWGQGGGAMDEMVPARGPQTRSGPVTLRHLCRGAELRQPLEMAARARSEPQGRSKWLLEPASEPQGRSKLAARAFLGAAGALEIGSSSLLGLAGALEMAARYACCIETCFR
jgi:hypothetical protein